jgi:AcrR family transcriptional regulator
MMSRTKRERRYTPDETRRRLIEHGLDLFGRRGLDGVSTRTLAEAAQANISAIPYHFGSKEALYKAVAEHIVASIGVKLCAAAEHAQDRAKDIRREDAAECAGDLLAAVAGTLVNSPQATAYGGFVVREQLQPTAAFDIIYAGVIEPVHLALSALVARALGTERDDAETIFRAHALIGQALVFATARAALLRRLDRNSLRREDVDQAVAVLRLHAKLVLVPHHPDLRLGRLHDHPA